jgi:hypothetical protein
MDERLKFMARLLDGEKMATRCVGSGSPANVLAGGGRVDHGRVMSNFVTAWLGSEGIGSYEGISGGGLWRLHTRASNTQPILLPICSLPLMRPSERQLIY